MCTKIILYQMTYRYIWNDSDVGINIGKYLFIIKARDQI